MANLSSNPHPASADPPSSSNPPNATERIHDLEYLYASNANVSNFVSVKLFDNGEYHLWEAQMLCLMESHNMRGIVDDTFDGPRASSMEIMKQYDSLLKGWIFGSISKDALSIVVKLNSARAVWKKLKSIYDPSMNIQQGWAGNDHLKAKAETEAKRNDTKKTQGNDNTVHLKKLHKATVEGHWREAETILRNHKDAASVPISKYGSTVLHIAVGKGHNDFVKKLLQFIEHDEILESTNSDGSTALHVAAIVGNTYAAGLLVTRRKHLLQISDHEVYVPLLRAYYNMHLDTFVYLLEAAEDDDSTKQQPRPFGLFAGSGVQTGVNLLAKAISAKQYDLASKLVHKYPELAAKNDDVLMAIARTFPSGLDYGETLFYPSLGNISERIVRRSSLLFYSYEFLYSGAKEITGRMTFLKTMFSAGFLLRLFMILLAPMVILVSVYRLICLLVLMVYFPFFMLYFFLWKVAATLVAPIKHIEKKKKEHEDAKKILNFVCDEIDKLEFSGSHHPFYTRPILEATGHNAYEVVDEILFRSPETIRCKNKNGHDIIQLAIIQRSEKIYNLIYYIPELRNLYRTIKDSSNNNILHLAGRIAPSHKLNRRTGAALQLQNELQWHEEVEKIVFPTYVSEENIFQETPQMVFTREHENLVREGEQWMKTTAESCTITAALITTIVFAAAITVPGGSNQDTGIPLFTKEIAFVIFAISDAISLFTSATSLLVFLSILTARFAEQDFLVSLPKRLIIGLCTLLLSTTMMMVAFSATLFLVFAHKKTWMLGPICGLACLPIVLFDTSQFPLIVDLFWSTYVSSFGKQSKNDHGRFNPDDIQLLFW